MITFHTIDNILIFLYALGMIFILMLYIPSKLSHPGDRGIRTPRNNARGRTPRVSVILPVYHEGSAIVEKCLDSLVRQGGVALDVVMVAKDIDRGMLRGIASKYCKKFESFLVVRQNKGSLSDSYAIALKHIRTNYTYVINADVSLKANALADLYRFADSGKYDLAFGLVLPEIPKNSRFSKFPAISKLFRQMLIQVGRHFTSMGYYIPGCFYITTKTTLLRDRGIGYTDDFSMMLNMYSKGGRKIGLLPRVLSTELEKVSASSWLMQQSRWALGKLEVAGNITSFFRTAPKKIAFGTALTLFLWYILPYSIGAGLIILPFSGIYFWEAYAIYYAFLTSVLVTIRHCRRYGITYSIAYTIISSVISTLSVLLIPYMVISKSKRSVFFKR